MLTLFRDYISPEKSPNLPSSGREKCATAPWIALSHEDKSNPVAKNVKRFSQTRGAHNRHQKAVQNCLILSNTNIISPRTHPQIPFLSLRRPRRHQYIRADNAHEAACDHAAVGKQDDNPASCEVKETDIAHMALGYAVRALSSVSCSLPCLPHEHPVRSIDEYAIDRMISISLSLIISYP